MSFKVRARLLVDKIEPKFLRCLSFAVISLSIIAFIVFLFSTTLPPRELGIIYDEADDAVWVTTRKEMLERIGALEEYLLTIGTVFLGINAYFATNLFKREFSIERPKLFYAFVVFILFSTCVTYLHVWKVRTAYDSTVVRLEIAMQHKLQPKSRVFRYANSPHVTPWLTPFVRSGRWLLVLV